MAYRLRRGESPEAGVRRVAVEQIDGALADLDAGDDEAAVHDLRKRCKKLRALLRLVRPGLGERFRAENRCFRDVARAVAGRRDRDVLHGLLDALADDLDLDAAARSRARACVDTFAEAPGPDAPDVPAAGHASLRASLEAARERAGALALDGDADDALLRGLQRSHRDARRAFAAARSRPGTETWHEWRKRAKDLWYHARLLERCWPPVMHAWQREGHRLTEHLGDEHDLAMLAHALEAGQDASDAADPLAPLRREVTERRRAMRARATGLGSRLHAETPRACRRRVGAWWHAWRA